MRFSLCAVAAFALAGCINVTKLTGPDGKAAYTIDCHAERSGCFQKAGELCPAGYSILDASQGVVALNGMAAPKNELTISCK